METQKAPPITPPQTCPPLLLFSFFLSERHGSNWSSFTPHQCYHPPNCNRRSLWKLYRTHLLQFLSSWSFCSTLTIFILPRSQVYYVKQFSANWRHSYAPSLVTDFKGMLFPFSWVFSLEKRETSHGSRVKTMLVYLLTNLLQLPSFSAAMSYTGSETIEGQVARVSAVGTVDHEGVSTRRHDRCPWSTGANLWNWSIHSSHA